MSSAIASQRKVKIVDAVPVLLFSVLSIVITRYHSTRQTSSPSERDAVPEDATQSSKDSTIESTNRTSPQNKHIESTQELSFDEYALPSHVVRELRKEERRIAKMPLLAMKSPMYDNCELLDPHGTLLSKISRKKGRWYVSKGLGEWKSADENQVMLNFEPKARSSQSYGISKKENVCVICGSSENLIRFYIVPYVYRALFPDCYKSHMSHDIVIVCGYCHMNCERYTQSRMRELELMCRPPGGYPPKYIQNADLYQVRTCATALRDWKHKMPEEKVKQYESVVANYVHTVTGEIKTGSISAEDLEFTMNVEYQVENPHYVAPSEFVVKKIASDDEQIHVFVRSWRQYFVDTLCPKFMPIGWCVNHPVRCDDQ